MKNWTKKTAAAGLAAAMLLQAAGCGSSSLKTIYDALKMPRDFDAYEISMSASAKADGQTVKYSVEGTFNQKNQEGQMDLSVSVMGMKLEFENVIVKDGWMYIDLTELWDSSLFGNMLYEFTYEQMDREDVVDFLVDDLDLDEKIVGDLQVIGIEIGKIDSKAISASEDLSDIVIDAFKTGVESDKDILSSEKSTWTVTLDEDNIADFTEAMAEALLDKTDDIVKAVTTITESVLGNEVMESYIEMLEDAGADIDVDDIKDVIEDDFPDEFEELMEDIVDNADALEDYDPDVEIIVTADGKKAVAIEANAKATVYGDKYSVKIDGTITKASSPKISAPSEFTNATELMKAVLDEIN